jgi:hypothetical protein
LARPVTAERWRSLIFRIPSHAFGSSLRFHILHRKPQIDPNPVDKNQ